MNVLLLYLVLPVFFALFLYDVWLAYRLYHMSDKERAVAWGGLQGKVFYAFVLTYLLSCFGCTSSFVLYASMETPDEFSIFLFVVVNVSYLLFNYAFLREMKNLVLISLWTNVVVFVVLFVYTVVVFDGSSHASTVGFLVWTHFCNFVAVVHCYVIDLMIWYSGWIDAHTAYKTSPEIY